MKQFLNLMVLVVAITAISATVVADVPQVINYQGRLTNPSGDPVDTTVQVVFSICADSLGSACSWTEVHPNVVVTDGLFDVLLGSITPFTGVDFANDQRWLGVNVGGESLPYTRVVSVPWALTAAGVEGFSPGPNNVDEGLYSLLAGDSNTVLSDYSSITWGLGNLADAQVDADTIPDTSDIFNPPGGGPSPPDASTTGWGAFIGGGWGNHAHGVLTVVGGGFGNTSWCAYSATVGGFRNLSAGHFSFLGGGFRNSISSDTNCWCGYASVLAGGFLNTNDGLYSTISGGFGNRIQSCISGATISGGLRNTVLQQTGTIGGGLGNLSNGDGSTVGGGQYNNAVAQMATISGGGRSDPTNPITNNEVWDDYGTIGGGGSNKAGSNDGIEINAIYTTISGGRSNAAAADFATIGGGDTNIVWTQYATIGGGIGNEAGGTYSTIGGGEGNITQFNNHQTIGGGQNNYVPDPYGTIAGGLNNEAFTWATVGGGSDNQAINEFTFVGGGNHNVADGHASVVAGGLENHANNWTAAIGGGQLNSAFGAVATIAGGHNNQSQGDTTFIGGGAGNIATGPAATIGGGAGNTVTGNFSAVLGGAGNIAGAEGDAVGGGTSNVTGPGINSTVPGGFENEASADFCFAAGIKAKSVDSCSFVWADCCIEPGQINSTPYYSSGARTFNARATGGFYFLTSCDSLFDPATGVGTGVYLPAGGSQWLAGSDRNKKRIVQAVEGREMLERISQLPIYRWSYKEQDASIQHIGPMAQDFYSIFKIGDNDETIATLDPSGVALAAIKELYRANQKLETKTNEIEDLKAEMAQMKVLLKDILAQQRSTTGKSTELAAKP
ncbi:MAG: tail fiber domain-containing protein [candidate division Zixibacteria bacterium]|nr:tail fiber domain-containing protein [candidate division Zixibacteria bacterium]